MQVSEELHYYYAQVQSKASAFRRINWRGPDAASRFSGYFNGSFNRNVVPALTMKQLQLLLAVSRFGLELVGFWL